MINDLDKLVAQTLMFGFEGGRLDEVESQVRPLIEKQVAGFLLFADDGKKGKQQKNIFSSQQTKDLLAQLNWINQKNADVPLLFAVDYEGGQVDRFSHLSDSPKTQTAKQAATLTKKAFSQQADEMAAFCHQLGFNLNFAPVVDLDLSQSQGVINAMGRSFSPDPAVVSELAMLFVRPFLQRGIACCLKHFPGHGSATGDTHLEFVDVTDTYDNQELMPYQSLLQVQQPLITVMTAHITNLNLDKSGCPATLSETILQTQLRDKLSYQGVIISDDLQMRALADKYSLSQRLTMAMNAGCDLLIVGNQLCFDDPQEVIDTMVELVKNGDISQQRISEAADRVNRLKASLHVKQEKEEAV